MMCVGYLGLGAAWKVADVSEKSTVVIFGLGTVGLSVSSLLRGRVLFSYNVSKVLLIRIYLDLHFMAPFLQSGWYGCQSKRCCADNWG